MHSMDWATTPPLSWRVEEVEAWLGAVGLPHLAPAFRKGEVVGADLPSLSAEDLREFGCTAFQAKKIQAELAKIGAQAATGYPASPPAAAQAGSFSPPPAGYPAPAPYGAPGGPCYGPPAPAAYSYPPPPLQTVGSGLGSPMAPAYSGGASSMSLSASKEMDDLKAELQREKLKNNLRQEMSTSSRLAAMEALGRSGGGSGTVVSNNNNMSSSAACSSVAAANAAAAEATRAAAAATAAMAKAAQTPVIVGYQKYCGGTSWLIGICLFPCICCCPVDTRPVYGFPGMPMAITGGKGHKTAGPQNVYQPPRPTKMV